MNFALRSVASGELRALGAQLARATERSPVGFGLLMATGTWISVNEALRQMIGLGEAELPLPACVHPDDWAAHAGAFERVAAGEAPSASMTVRAVHPNGHMSWVELTLWPAAPQPPAGAGSGALACILRDVTVEREAGERLRLTLEQAPLGMVLAMPGGLWLETNRAMCDMLGSSAAELVGAVSFADVVHPEDHEVGARLLRATLAGDLAGYRLEQRFRHASGREVWADVTVSLVHRPDGLPLYVVAQVQDITDRRRAEQQLAVMTKYDHLTGLPNRTLLAERLADACARAKEDGTTLAVLVCDVDHFGSVNDGLGHDLGDQVLLRLAARLRSAVRPGDTVARLGGDEFAVVSEGHDSSSAAEALAGRLRAVVDVPVVFEEHRVHLTASVGMATVSGAAAARRSPFGLLHDAETALYAAKRAGRNRHELFSVDLREAAFRRHRLANDLRAALELGQFEVHHQPIVELDAGAVVGYEALARWRHPDRGLLRPAAFLEVVEESRPLMSGLGEVVLVDACRQQPALAALAGGAAWVSVNVSARQLGHGRFSRLVGRTLEDTGLDPAALHLELTESVLVDGDDDAVADLLAARSLGVKLAIDDFGTGWASLSYLKRLPFDYLKIDRQFVAGVDRGEDQIAAAVIQLADALGISIIAEGVEAPEEAVRLRELGCPLAQGYHFGRPAPLAEVAPARSVPPV